MFDCLNKGRFLWGSDQTNNFEVIKTRLTTAPILALPNFDKVFEVETNASIASIGAIFSQEERLIKNFQ